MTSTEKKRKRASATFKDATIVNAETTNFPPIVASTAGIAFPDLPFTPYARVDSAASKKKKSRPEYLLHGTNARLDYEGLEDSSELVKHYVGIYDPATGTVELHLAPAVQVKSSVKAHRQRDLENQNKGSESTFAESRVALGKAFGTRKAQSALTSREINKVDASGVDANVGSAILGHVEENTKDMPSTEELGKSLQSDKPLPKYNKDAEKVADIYRREDLISEEEWNSLWIKDWVENNLADTKFVYVKTRATRLLEDHGDKKYAKELKILKYIASLMDFFVVQSKARGKLMPLHKAKGMFKHTPPAVIEAFYEKFAEVTPGQQTKDETGKLRNNDRYSVPPRLEQKILFWIAILSLMVDQYDVDMFDLKTDLSIQPKELSQVFREVGCSIKELTQLQAQNLGVTKQEALQRKRAVLKVPLEFPPPPRKRAAAGRR
ncbi:RNA polymerase I associated factor, A49-like protein [Pyronema omphalodes]|nr:RNA polymerase I associated factor, A49-like protein [Pyronema omphalodes]